MVLIPPQEIPTLSVRVKATWGAAWGADIDFLRVVGFCHCLAPADPWAKFYYRYGMGRPQEASAFGVEVSSDTTTATVPEKLVDAGADFVTAGVAEGMLALNTTTGKSTTVSAVDDLNTLSVSEDIFEITDSYEIRSVLPAVDLSGQFVEIRGSFPAAVGTTDATTAGKLEDSGATFLSDGLLPGTPVQNDTDDTWTVVTKIDSDTVLSVEEDIFATGEDYIIGGTRSLWTGYIPVAQDTQQGTGYGRQLIQAKGLDFMLARASISGTITDDGIGKRMADGTTTSTSAGELVDSGATFVADGILPGMRVLNTTDGTETTVQTVDSETTLTLVTNIFTTGEDYDIRSHVIDAPATFNTRHGRGGGPRGNRSTSTDGLGVYRFSGDGEVWTNEQIAEHVLKYYAPLGVAWDLSASNDLLNAITEAHDFAGLDARQCLNELVDAKQGLAWHVPQPPAGFGPGDTISIEVVSRFDTDITEGGLTVSKNPKEVEVSADDETGERFDTDITDCTVRTDENASFDKIVVRGRALACFTASVPDGSLEKDWLHVSGTTDGTTADKLVDSGATFVTDGVVAGMFAANLTDRTTTTVSAVDSETVLSVADDIFVSGDLYEIGPEAEYRWGGGENEKENDANRTDDKFEGVYSRLRIPRAWTWLTKDGAGGGTTNIVLPAFISGAYDYTRTGGYWNRNKLLAKELPFLRGFDYSHDGADRVTRDMNAPGTEAEYRRPFALLKDPADDKWHLSNDLSQVEKAKRKGCHLRMCASGLAVDLRPRPAHLIASVDFAVAGAGASNVEALFDWRVALFTVCVEMDDRPFREVDIWTPVAGAVPKTLTIDISDCELHWCATDTIVGLDTDGTPNYFWPALIANGTTDATTAGKLEDSGATFIADGVRPGMRALNITGATEARIVAVDSETVLSVTPDVFLTGEVYEITSNVLRDDSDMLEAVMAAARAWYSAERKELSYGRRRLLMNLAPGTMVTDLVRPGHGATAIGPGTTIGTIVESREFDGQGYTTTVKTGLGAILFSAFATSGQRRIDKKGMAQIARTVDSLAREADRAPARIADAVGERVGPEAPLFFGMLGDDGAEVRWSNGASAPATERSALASGDYLDLYLALLGNKTDAVARKLPTREGHVRRLRYTMKNRLASNGMAIGVYPMFYQAKLTCPDTLFGLVLTFEERVATVIPAYEGDYVRINPDEDGKPQWRNPETGYLIFWVSGSNHWRCAPTLTSSVYYYTAAPTPATAIWLATGGATGTPTANWTAWVTVNTSANTTHNDQQNAWVNDDELLIVRVECLGLGASPAWAYDTSVGAHPILTVPVECEWASR